MTARVWIKSIIVNDERKGQHRDVSQLSGTVLIEIDTEYGQMQVNIPFSNVPLLNDVAVIALERFRRLVVDIDQAVRAAETEHVFSVPR